MKDGENADSKQDRNQGGGKIMTPRVSQQAGYTIIERDSAECG